MSFTLHDATLELARILGDVVTSTADDDGSTTTLIDSANERAPDYYKDGTIWFLSGELAGVSAAISAYDQPNKKYTFPTQTAATADGDRYAVMNKQFRRYELIQAINQALRRDIGGIPAENTSLVTVEDQPEYDLPSGVFDVSLVEIATNTSEPYDYQTWYHWREQGGKLIFEDAFIPQTDDYIIRLQYRPYHDELVDDDDTIDDLVLFEFLVWAAAVQALRRKISDVPDAGHYADNINEAIQERDKLHSAAMARLHLPRTPKLAIY
jgi:hypothetical protein